MSKKAKVVEVKDWKLRDFPVELRRRIKGEAGLHGETISQCLSRLLKRDFQH